MNVINYVAAPPPNSLFGKEQHQAKSGDTKPISKILMRNRTGAGNAGRFMTWWRQRLRFVSPTVARGFTGFFRLVAESVAGTLSANTPVGRGGGGGFGWSERPTVRRFRRATSITFNFWPSNKSASFPNIHPGRGREFTALGKLKRKGMKKHDARWHCKQHQSGLGSIPLLTDWWNSPAQRRTWQPRSCFYPAECVVVNQSPPFP